MALAGAIVGMLYWLKPIPAPRLVPLVAAATASPALAPLPTAEADLLAVSPLGTFSLRGKPTAGADRHPHGGRPRRAEGVRGRPGRRLAAGLFPRQRPARRPPARGGRRPGQVMILPADADPVNPANWVPLRSVLKALAACRAPNKLLLLDIVQTPGDPAFDLLTPGLVGRIDEELKAVADPPRLDPHRLLAGRVAARRRTTWAVRSSGSTWRKGLRGWADVDATGYKRDGIVTGGRPRRVRLGARRPLGAAEPPRPPAPARSTSTAPAPRTTRSATRISRSPSSPGASRKPHLGLAKPRAYPDWLSTGWRRLEHWRAGGSGPGRPLGVPAGRGRPAVGRSGVAAGLDPSRVKAFLDAELSAFVAHQEKLRAGPRPEPHVAGRPDRGRLRTRPRPCWPSVRALAKRAGDPPPGRRQEGRGRLRRRARTPPTATSRWPSSPRRPTCPSLRRGPSSRSTRAQAARVAPVRRDAGPASPRRPGRADPSSWSPGDARERVLDLAAKAARAENRAAARWPGSAGRSTTPRRPATTARPCSASAGSPRPSRPTPCSRRPTGFMTPSSRPRTRSSRPARRSTTPAFALARVRGLPGRRPASSKAPGRPPSPPPATCSTTSGPGPRATTRRPGRPGAAGRRAPPEVGHAPRPARRDPRRI